MAITLGSCAPFLLWQATKGQAGAQASKLGVLKIKAKVYKRGIVATVAVIVFVALMGIGFAFKRDVKICPFCIAILQQSYQPFYKIPYKESYKQEFALL